MLVKLKTKICKFNTIFNEINLKDSFDKLKECDILFFCHDVDRSIFLNDCAYSPLIDSVKDDFERRGYVCQSISLPWSVLTDKRGQGSPVCINRSIFFQKLKTYLLKITRLNIFFEIGSVYAKILIKTKAKLIISIGSPDDLSHGARLKGVFHVELLHGLGYTSIQWGWTDKDIEFLPQGILALDNISHETFKPLVSKGIEIKTVPHPFLKRFLNTELNEIPYEWLPKKNKGEKWQKEILISFQWAYAGDHGPYIEYANLLRNGLFYEEIEQIVKEEQRILFRFRFHPVQLKSKKYRYLVQFMDFFVEKYPNTEWKESSFLPYPSIVKSCDGNISMSSMSCYDAATIGVPSLMLCPTIQPGGVYEDWFEDLVREGYVIKSKVDKKVLQNWVQSTEKIEPRLSNLKDEGGWENAVEWLLSESGLKRS